MKKFVCDTKKKDTSTAVLASIVPSEITNDYKCFQLGNLKFPYPICQICGKQVEKFTVKESIIYQGTKYQKLAYKFEVECHGGYEMYKIDKSTIDEASSIEPGIAFKRN